ncbi:MAG: helix-turn-helix transcriptional regulator [Mediterranea sp.]|nr:helix-turn-helix transcriptional regulator [Mediterranea sp.]
MKDRHGISNWISVLLRPISFTNDGRTEIAITTASYSLSPFHHLAYIRNLENRTEYILGDKGTWEKIYYEPLDSRELSTLRLTAQGYVNKEISTQVGLTESYVKKIKKSAYAKLHAANINEAISAAFRMHVRYF